MKATRKITYRVSLPYGTGYPEHIYPELRISGKFLTEKYGLKVGDTVKVKYLKDKIVIKK